MAPLLDYDYQVDRAFFPICDAECWLSTYMLAMQSGDQSVEITELRALLEHEVQKREQLEQELKSVKTQLSKRSSNGSLTRLQGDELLTVRHKLEEELKVREKLEEEIRHLKEQVGLLGEENDEVLSDLFNMSNISRLG